MSIAASIFVRRNDCPRIAARLGDAVDDALDNAVATCIEVADPLTPVDTGALRANKSIERGNYSRTVTWNQDYAVYQEKGTVHIPARPFAEPGADAAMPVLVSDLEGIFR